MRLDLDSSSPIPLYLQIVEEVRRLVAAGALRGGDRLPPVRELASRSRINRNTAARAIQQLEAEGVVRTRVGQGTFVKDGAGSFQRAQRDGRIDRAIDRLLDEARRLGVPVEDLRQRFAARATEATHPESDGSKPRRAR